MLMVVAFPRAATRMRARGWRLACAEASRDVGFLPGLGLGPQPAGAATLANALAARLRRALHSGSPPLVCAACRAAGAEPWGC